MTTNGRVLMRMEIWVEARFEYKPGSTGHNMGASSQGDAQPGCAPQVQRVLSLNDADTGADLMALCASKEQEDGLRARIEAEFERDQ